MQLIKVVRPEAGHRETCMAFVIVVALIWGIPLAIVLAMALGSLISRHIRRYCAEQLIGTLPSEPDSAWRTFGAAKILIPQPCPTADPEMYTEPRSFIAESRISATLDRNSRWQEKQIYGRRNRQAQEQKHRGGREHARVPTF